MTSFLVGFFALLISIWFIGIWRGILIFLVMFLCWSLTDPGIHFATPTALEAEVKANCHSIRVGLERYAEENDGSFPDEITSLTANDYLSEFPTNPFSRNEMKSVDLGSEEFEGNFLYIPVHEEDDVIGYYILGYGYERNRGIDVDGDGIGDHVILVLDSVAEEEFLNLPPLEELLAH
jgi:hypothetical protein